MYSLFHLPFHVRKLFAKLTVVNIKLHDSLFQLLDRNIGTDDHIRKPQERVFISALIVVKFVAELS